MAIKQAITNQSRADRQAISREEEDSIDLMMINVLDQACINLHNEQCKLVASQHLSGAQRVELVLQVQEHINRMQASIKRHDKFLTRMR